MRGRVLAVFMTASAFAPAAAAASIPPDQLAAARLQGFYGLSGRVTTAVGVPGEHRGDKIARVWVLTSSCPRGGCGAVTLTRQRAAGSDTLTLHRARPGYYRGQGAFLAPARCHKTMYRKGLRVPFTITLTVTAVAAQPDGTVLATRFTAGYRNVRRIGLTRCFSPPSYDSARYAGTSEPAPGAAIRTVRSTRSSTGS